MSESCLFCRIVAEEVPADVVLSTDRALAFRDIAPVAPTHVLVIPRTHQSNVATTAAVEPDTVAHLVEVAGRVAEHEGLADYRLVLNTGAGVGQSVFHTHLHVLGGRPMAWPPG